MASNRLEIRWNTQWVQEKANGLPTILDLIFWYFSPVWTLSMMLPELTLNFQSSYQYSQISRPMASHSVQIWHSTYIHTYIGLISLQDTMAPRWRIIYCNTRVTEKTSPSPSVPDMPQDQWPDNLISKVHNDSDCSQVLIPLSQFANDSNPDRS